MKIEEIDNILTAYKSMQDMNNSLDNLEDSVIFKHDIKKRSKMLQRSLDLVLNQLYSSMSQVERESFNKVILSGGNVVSSVKV